MVIRDTLVETDTRRPGPLLVLGGERGNRGM